MKNYGLSLHLMQRLFTAATATNIQVAIDHLFESMEKHNLTDRANLIFLVSTLYIECPTLIPCIEDGSENYFRDLYGDALGKYIDGFPQFGGRGYPQLTGRDQYIAAGASLELDFIDNPDLLLDPKISMDALVWCIDDHYYQEPIQQYDYTIARKRYNGGSNGLEDFLETVDFLREHLAK